jgi:hypothetical protein
MSKVADQKSGTDKVLPASGGVYPPLFARAIEPHPSGSLLYASCFLVDRRFLKTTHRTKHAAAMRKRTKNAFL